MDKKIENQIKDFTIEKLMQTSAGEKIEQALKLIEKLHDNAVSLYNNKDELFITSMKSVTVLTFAMLKVFAEGKAPGDITKEDWKTIANTVSEIAVLQDDRSYTVYVFSLYESYIRNYAEQVRELIDPGKADAVADLADKINEKTVLLNEGKISEVTYIEDCLWISLEAMVKLIASLASFAGDNRISEFTEAVTTFAFEFGRYSLYRKEQEIVNQFIDSQCIMDEELKTKYELFKAELEEQSNVFISMVERAFSHDFKESFISSVELAKASGVKNGEILNTEDEIDDFFLN